MFSAFSSLIETAAQKAKELSDAGIGIAQEAGLIPELEKGYDVESEGVSDNSSLPLDPHSAATNASDTGINNSLIVDDIVGFVPPQLQSAAGEWKVFLRGVLAEENTFCLPVHHQLNDDTAMNRLHTICGLSREHLESILADVDASEVSAALMSNVLQFSPEAAAMRFRIVPKFVLEDLFWKHLVTRCRIYYRCSSMAAVLDAMDILNKETRLRPQDARKHGFGNPCNGAELQKVRDDVNASAMISQWLEGKRNAAKSELQSAVSSLQLLLNLTAKREVSELADSVRESCKYRKTKIAGILGDLQTSAHKLVGTDLEVDTGDVYVDLLNLNAQLHDAVAGYQALVESQQQQASASTKVASLSTSGSAVLVSSPTSHVNTSTSSPQRVSTLASPGADETAFSADLPWEDDED